MCHSSTVDCILTRWSGYFLQTDFMACVNATNKKGSTYLDIKLGPSGKNSKAINDYKHRINYMNGDRIVAMSQEMLQRILF